MLFKFYLNIQSTLFKVDTTRTGTSHRKIEFRSQGVGGGILWISLGRGVPLGLWYPCSILHHVRLYFATLFWTRYEKFLPYSRLASLQELYYFLLQSVQCLQYPILDQSSLIYIPYARLNCSKPLPFTVAHTYTPYMWEYPPPLGFRYSKMTEKWRAGASTTIGVLFWGVCWERELIVILSVMAILEARISALYHDSMDL